MINFAQNAAVLPAIKQLKKPKVSNQDSELRQVKYLNHQIPDQRLIKRLVKPGLRLKSFHTARRTITSYEMLKAIRKEQIKRSPKGDLIGQKKFIESLFKMAV